MQSDVEKMTYVDARMKLKEAELLFIHRRPLRPNVEPLVSHWAELGGVTGFLIVLSSVISASATGAFPTLLALGGVVIFASSLALMASLGYDGNPENKIQMMLSKILLTKRQRSIQKKYNQSIEDYRNQTKIFQLFVQKKKEELENSGVFSVLTSGNPEFYPQINDNGTVSKLTPHEWVRMQNREYINAKNTEENIKYLLDR